MSNQVTLVATTFNAHVQGTETHGFCIYDSYGKAYDNNSESPIVDDLELLDYALTIDDDTIKDMLRHVKDMEEGITINRQFYDWDEIGCHFG